MTQSDVPVIRKLACSDAFSFSKHALDMMLDRDITYDDVKAVLESSDNQLIDCQSPSQTKGKEHNDVRLLIYDPTYSKEIIVVCVLLLQSQPEIRIVTTELVDYSIWEKKTNCIPVLIRK